MTYAPCNLVSIKDIKKKIPRGLLAKSLNNVRDPKHDFFRLTEKKSCKLTSKQVFI
jgi:hypothetical protein